jgi:gas vesicle protein
MGHQNKWDESDHAFPAHIFLFGALAGSLIGAGVGLLFAPWSGVTTRRRLRRYAERALEDTVENGREALTDAMEKGREYVEDGMQKMSKAAKQAWRDTSQFAGRAR